MEPELIAVFIFLLLAVGFAVFVLQITAAEVNSKIKKRVIDEMQSYDALIQQREAKVEALNRELMNYQNGFNAGGLASKQENLQIGRTVLMPQADYTNESLFFDYKKICENFAADDAAIEEKISHLEPCCDERTTKIFAGLADKLSFSNVYKIAELRVEEQKDVLEYILTDDEKKILKEYCSQVDSFDCIGFYSWFQVRLKNFDPTVHVLTAWEENMKDADSKICVQHDGKLCEGFQIRVSNRLLDFGIRKSELN